MKNELKDRIKLLALRKKVLKELVAEISGCISTIKTQLSEQKLVKQSCDNAQLSLADDEPPEPKDNMQDELGEHVGQEDKEENTQEERTE